MITKYLLQGKDIVTIQVEFEDQFKIVFRYTDVCGKFTINKVNNWKEIYQIFDSIEELIEYRIKKVEKEVIDMQKKLKTICEEHAEFLKKYKKKINYSKIMQ